MGMWFAGFVSGIVSMIVVSLCVTLLAMRFMRRVDRNAGPGIESGIQDHNPMEGIEYHGPEDTPGE